MKSIEPYSKHNAVKVIAFAIKFSENISNENIKKLIVSIRETVFFTKEFGNNMQNEIALTTIQNTGQQTQALSGVICDKINEKSKLEWSLIVNKEMILIKCTTYTRWSEVSQIAYEYIEEVFKLMDVNNQQISQIKLEYLDEFKILDNRTNWKQVLFTDENKYLTSNIYESDDFWHIDTGSFIKFSQLDERILEIVNIQYFADEEDELKHKINIRMHHTLDYNKKYNSNAIVSIFDIIHFHSKNIFENIIHNNILKDCDIGESQ